MTAYLIRRIGTSVVILTVVGNLVADVALTIADPRIRLR